MVSAAASDRETVCVSRQPRIAIIATGDELVLPGCAAQLDGAQPDSVSYGVAGQCIAMGAKVVLRSLAPDRIEELAEIGADALAQADCIVVCGGASVGEYDLSRAMFARAEFAEIFTKVAMKPGKPVWLAMVAGKLVLGLPGNPTSAMVTARLFLRPLLAALQGGPLWAELAFQPLPLAAPLPQTGSRETFFRASGGPQGLVPVDNRYSGAQAPLLASDWLIRRPVDGPPCVTGDLVHALPF
jgi:molybdopterin molybdotransferase